MLPGLLTEWDSRTHAGAEGRLWWAVGAGLCEGERQKGCFHGRLHPRRLALLSIFLWKNPHNINISLLSPPPDYIIPPACKNKKNHITFEYEEECKMPAILFCQHFGDDPRKQVARRQGCWHKCGPWMIMALPRLEDRHPGLMQGEDMWFELKEHLEHEDGMNDQEVLAV